MNNRFETRARQNRTTALILTFLFHVALIAGIYYYNMDDKTAAKTETSIKTQEEASAKPVNVRRNYTKP